MDLTVTQRLMVIAETKGVSAAAAEMEKFAASQEKTAGGGLSVERALERTRKSLDANYNSFKQFERAQNDLIKAQQQGLVGINEYNKLSALNKQRYEDSTRAAGQFATAMNKGTGEARLARHELINLSRQFQDVGVSLSSGQAPLTVLVQQGSQIADVFASSSGTLRGFFGQVAAGAGRFITSATGMAASVAAVGTGIAALAVSYSNAQREIERSLAGIGRASGVTRDQINKIAGDTSSPFGLSVSEAREAAAAFAATGRIYQENVTRATLLTKQFAIATGVDAADAGKALRDAMLDPAKGALELNKSIGFLDVTTLNYIRTLQATGNMQGAQAALLDAMKTKTMEMAEQAGIMEKAWTASLNYISNRFNATKKVIAQGLGNATTVDLGGYSLDEQLKGARAKLASRRESPFQGSLAQPGIRNAEEEVLRLEKAIEKLNRDIQEGALNQLGLDANAAARSIVPMRAEIEALEQQLSKLRAAADAGVDGPGNSAAIQVGNIRLTQLREQEAVTLRIAQYTEQLQAKYAGMTIAGATLLQQAQNQLTLAQARTGAEQIIAQEKIRQKDAALAQLPIAERLRIAATERQAAEAQVAKTLNDQIRGLEDELKLIEARANGNEAAAKAEIAYRKAIESGPGMEGKAQQIAGLTERVEAAREEERASSEMVDNAKQIGNTFATAVNNWSAMENSSGNMVQDAWEMEAARRAAMSITDRLDEDFAVGGKSQFGKYEGTTESTELITSMMKRMFERFGGEGNVRAVAGGLGPNLYFPTEAGIKSAQSYDLKKLEDAQFGTFVQRSDAHSTSMTSAGSMGLSSDLMTAFNSAIKIGKGVSDVNTGYLQRLVNLAPDEQKGSMLTQMIEEVRKQPSTLAREELLKSLNDQLKSLTDATNGLNDTMKLQLDPLFSQGHDYINKLKIGYYKNADGGMLGPGGRIPLMPINRYAEGGIATSPQMAMFGEAGPEAFVPLKGGAIPVTMRGGNNDNSKVVNNYNSITIAAGATATPQKRLTARQLAQGFARGATQAAMAS